MAKYKKGKCKLLIVTGVSSKYRDEIKEIPEVDFVVGVSGYCEMAGIIDKLIIVALRFSSKLCTVIITAYEYLTNDRCFHK